MSEVAIFLALRIGVGLCLGLMLGLVLREERKVALAVIGVGAVGIAFCLIQLVREHGWGQVYWALTGTAVLGGTGAALLGQALGVRLRRRSVR